MIHTAFSFKMQRQLHLSLLAEVNPSRCKIEYLVIGFFIFHLSFLHIYLMESDSVSATYHLSCIII
jgi:hypothetical protein